MTNWGPYEDRNGSRLRVGIDIDRSPSTITHSTTSIDLTVRFYVDSDSGDFSGDTQTMHFGGAFGGSTTFTNNSGTKLVATKSLNNVPLYYSGAGTRTFSARISGAYNGVTPSHSVKYNVPARPADVPDAPSTPSVSSIGTTSCVVSWNAPSSNGSSIVDYQVRVMRMGSTVDVENTSSRSKTMGPLEPGTNYGARVRAKNGVGWGGYSNFRYFTTDVALPGIVSGRNTTNITPTSARLNWSAPDSGGGTIDKYQVRWDSGAVAGWDGDVESENSLEDISNLKPATDYSWHVRAHNEAGWGSWTTVAATFTTEAAPPNAPTWGSVEALDHESIRVTWKAATTNGSAVDAYRVEVATSSSFGTIVANPLFGGSDRTADITGLSANTTYYVRVRAGSPAGSGPNSSTKVVTTDPTPITDPALAPQVVSKTATTATLKGVAGTMTREFQLALDDDFETGLQDHEVTTASSKFFDLVPGTTYYARYRVDSGTGYGDYSPAAEFSTPRRPVRWDGEHWADDITYWAGDDWAPPSEDMKIWDGESWS